VVRAGALRRGGPRDADGSGRKVVGSDSEGIGHRPSDRDQRPGPAAAARSPGRAAVRPSQMTKIPVARLRLRVRPSAPRDRAGPTESVYATRAGAGAGGPSPCPGVKFCSRGSKPPVVHPAPLFFV
jgi:hypothetical protein